MVIIRVDKISSIVCERIEHYNGEVGIVNTGIVTQVSDDIDCSYGFDEVIVGEIVEFEEGTIGITLELNYVGTTMNDSLMIQERSSG